MRGQRNKQQVAVTSKDAEVFDDGGENEDEEDESTESEPEWTGEDEKSFLRTLGALKGNVPEIYNKEEKFFKKEAVEWKKKEKKEKKLRPNDYQRQLFEKHDGRVEEDHVEQNGAPEHGEGYFETQERLKNELKSALTALDSDDEDGGGFLVKKELSEQDKRKAEDEYYEFLKGQQKDEDSEDAAPAADKDIRLLKKVWTDPKIDESEQFLRDYLLNKEYEADSNVDSDAAAALSEEEADVEKQDQFEAKYNFRYEDPDQDFIKTYPRTFASTLREKKDSRKKKREAKKERKLKEKDEIIKKIKLDSVSVAAKLKAESGKEVGEDDLEGDFDPAAHDALMNKLFPDDEPAEGEEMEKPTFSDDDEDDPFKVSLSDDDLLASNANLVPLTTKRKFVRQEPSGDVEMEEAADADEGEGAEGDVQEGTGEMGEDWQEGEGGDGDEEGDEDDMRPRNKKDRRRKRKRAAKRDGKVEEGTEGKRPRWDPAKMTLEEYIDKHYNAECEDVIDDLQTRFKYRKVKANNFGLSLEEILGAEDKELNKWAGFRKVIGCHTEEDEERMFKQYKKREGKKMEVLRSLYKPEAAPEAEQSQDKKSKKKSKKEKEAAEAGPSEDPAEPSEETPGKDTVDNAEKDATETAEGEEPKDGEKKKRTRRRKKNKGANENGEEKKTEENADEGETQGDAGEKEKEEEEPKELTPEEEAALQKKKEKEEKKKRALAVKDERLKAYGLNPNKFKHSVKYDKRYGKKFVKKVAKESGDEDSD